MTIDYGGARALRAREAGYSVARKCLDVQADAELADPTLRTDHGVRLHPDALSWYVGCLGEIEVGRMLAQLGPEWLVLHSVPIGAKTTDVDHLVIGPAGVFVINTKHHARASIWLGDRAEKVNGTTEHYGERSLREARNVAGRLAGLVGGTVPVHPVVAFVGCRGIKDSRPEDARPVEFLPAENLIHWLRSLPPVFSAAQVALLTDAAEEPSTWHVDPRAADTSRVMPRFERLRADVERGRDHASSPSPGRAARSQRQKPPRADAQRTSTGRLVATAILAVIALAVSVPVVVALASLAVGNWLIAIGAVGVIVLFAASLLSTDTKRRRPRRRR